MTEASPTAAVEPAPRRRGPCARNVLAAALDRLPASYRGEVLQIESIAHELLAHALTQRRSERCQLSSMRLARRCPDGSFLFPDGTKLKLGRHRTGGTFTRTVRSPVASPDAMASQAPAPRREALCVAVRDVGCIRGGRCFGPAANENV